MRVAIFTFVRYSENSMVASIRIARWLSDQLQVPVIDQTNIDEAMLESRSLDLLIIVNGAYGFCKCLPEFAKLVMNAKRIVWVQNDFTIIPPKTDSQGVSPFRAAFRERHISGKPDMDFWTTCEDWQSITRSSRYVNWNALTFDENYSPARIQAMRKISYASLLYYGSFRAGTGKSSRVRYFDRYFNEPKVNTIISSPAKQFREKYLNPKIKHYDSIKEDFYEFLGKQGLGLYLEDRMSHEKFHSPANRFYEMLSAGLPMVFQPEAESMMARAGYKIEPWIVRNPRNVSMAMDHREEIGQRQRQEWIDDKGGPKVFRRTLTDQFNTALQLQKDLLA